MIRKVSVQASKNYDILIGENLISEVGSYILEVHKPCKVLMISDSTVSDLYNFPVTTSLQLAGFEVTNFVFPPGEESKCLNTIYDIVDILAEDGFTRSDLIVALGGGIVGDVAGFAASIYQRGIEFVQIPTTLLAAVDSSVGGKTGVNLEAGKNLVGAFWQPSLVICDCSIFKTLPYEVFLDGVAEAIKYGCIEDRSLFDLIKSEGRNLYKSLSSSEDEKTTGLSGFITSGIILSSDSETDTNLDVNEIPDTDLKSAGNSDASADEVDRNSDGYFNDTACISDTCVDAATRNFNSNADEANRNSDANADEADRNFDANDETLLQIIERCIQIKAAIVAQDERDTEVRQLLNFGHTIGHAIEKTSNFGISHGHAVAMGMLIITRACAKLGLCPEDCGHELQSMLTEFGFPTDCPHSSEALLEAALKDKKRAGQSITLVVPKTIGECVLRKIPIEQLSDYIIK